MIGPASPDRGACYNAIAVLMRLRVLPLLMLGAMGVASFPTLASQADGSELWRSLAPGIEYREFYQAEPNHLYVARMERGNPIVTLESSLALGSITGGLETVSQMAERYDQALNWWGEEKGGRNMVVVAINGSFFDPNTGVAWSGAVHSGWYAKRFAERENGSGFVWTLDRVPFIGGCIVHRPQKQLVTLVKAKKTIRFDGLNQPRGENDLIVYTPQFNVTTLTGDKGLEILVEMDQPLMILPEPSMVEGTVQAVLDGQGSTPIPFDHIVLSASGTARQQLLGKVKPGDRIGISQEIAHFEPDCILPSPYSWTKAYASVATSFVFLRQGVIQRFDDLGAVLRNPRTAIAYNDRYIFYIVVDGRDRYRSLGMSMAELGAFAKLSLNASWGVALDGGGSSTMVVEGRVKNHPNAELKDRPEQETGVPAPEPTQAEGVTERAVANGMLMVVMLPRELSTQFEPGDRVTTLATSEVNLRLGPGTNYAVLTSLLPGSTGIILPHTGKMNGVFAKDEYWWKVAFGELVGWVGQSLIQLIP